MINEDVLSGIEKVWKMQHKIILSNLNRAERIVFRWKTKQTKEEKNSKIKTEESIYLIHLKLPSFHSWSSPKNRKEQKIIIETIKFEEKKTIGNTITTDSSTSKIKNKRANKKNRKENGSRAENLGENPHS